MNWALDADVLVPEEITRIVREYGTEGLFGGQAYVGDVGGVMREMADAVNVCGANVSDIPVYRSASGWTLI